MKLLPSIKALLTFGVCSVGGLSGFAQSGGEFDLTWATVDTGGGTGTGGIFTVSGTVGQHDASATLTNCCYELTGGFWGISAAIQTPGAPTLRVTQAAGVIVISWPASAGSRWVLQQTPALVSPGNLIVWTEVSTPPVVVGAENTVTHSVALAPNRFYRLHCR